MWQKIQQKSIFMSASHPKWMSADGTLHLVFSGEDSFSVRQARSILGDRAN